MLAPAATPPSPPSGARPSVVALPRLGGLGSCWGAIRFGSESRPGQVRHGRLVVGGLRSQWLTVVVSSCSVGPRGMQHETGRGRWTPGAGASSPRPRTGPGPPVSGDWAGRNLNLTRGPDGLSGSVALCANFNEGSQAGPLMVGLGPRPCVRVSAGSPSTDESLSLVSGVVQYIPSMAADFKWTQVAHRCSDASCHHPRNLEAECTILSHRCGSLQLHPGPSRSLLRSAPLGKCPLSAARLSGDCSSVC